MRGYKSARCSYKEGATVANRTGRVSLGLSLPVSTRRSPKVRWGGTPAGWSRVGRSGRSGRWSSRLDAPAGPAGGHCSCGYTLWVHPAGSQLVDNSTFGSDRPSQEAGRGNRWGKPGVLDDCSQQQCGFRPSRSPPLVGGVSRAPLTEDDSQGRLVEDCGSRAGLEASALECFLPQFGEATCPGTDPPGARREAQRIDTSAGLARHDGHAITVRSFRTRHLKHLRITAARRIGGLSSIHVPKHRTASSRRRGVDHGHPVRLALVALYVQPRGASSFRGLASGVLVRSRRSSLLLSLSSVRRRRNHAPVLRLSLVRRLSEQVASASVTVAGTVAGAFTVPFPRRPWGRLGWRASERMDC